MNRRDMLLGSAAATAACAGALSLPSARRAEAAVARRLTIQPASFRLRDRTTTGLVSLSPDAPPPVIHGHQGKPMQLEVENATGDYTAMHWHGLRIANAMDGVPYLTQMPIAGGERFTYDFTPPDAGTYWYHPHCMTMTQMAHGLTGVMVIAEAEDPGFDVDQVLNLRDFRLDAEGALLPAFTARGAARAGTFGNLVTANWRQAPVYDHSAGGLVRLRVVNSDTTRIYRLRLRAETGQDAMAGQAQIIAWDGHPVAVPVALPSKAAPLLLGPGQRVDIALRMPSGEGQKLALLAELPGSPDHVMAELRAAGVDLARDLREVKPLPANPVPRPDLERAELHEFVFGWTPEGGAPNDGYCGSMGYSFWSINRQPWPGDAAKGTGPLAVLERGKSYVLRLRNESPNLHPIHLHGLAFVPFRSNLRQLPPLVTDTLLLLKDETVEVALVADNPGDWAFHCHVIEHQKTGLAGYIRVT